MYLVLVFQFLYGLDFLIIKSWKNYNSGKYYKGKVSDAMRPHNRGMEPYCELGKGSGSSVFALWTHSVPSKLVRIRKRHTFCHADQSTPGHLDWEAGALAS